MPQIVTTGKTIFLRIGYSAMPASLRYQRCSASFHRRKPGLFEQFVAQAE
jgi:hypothetical protein